jgi:hypothetical protein
VKELRARGLGFRQCAIDITGDGAFELVLYLIERPPLHGEIEIEAERFPFSLVSTRDAEQRCRPGFASSSTRGRESIHALTNSNRSTEF